MSDYLPEEVFTTILCKLPFESIVQCAGVCKSWRSHIASPAFVSTRLTGAKDNDFLLSIHPKSHVGGEEQYWLLGSAAAAGSDDEFVRLPPCPEIFNRSWARNRVMGSCNGVLCLAHQIRSTSVAYFLWNPSIGKSVFLPETQFLSSEVLFVGRECLGFGFDHRTSDYKVLRIVPCCYRKQFERVWRGIEIYSLNAGFWRNISNVAISTLEFVGSDAPAVFFNGFLHFVSFQRVNNGGFRNRVLAFDVGNEVFREFKLPEPLAGVWPYGLYIRVYKESIAVVDDNLSPSEICVWVMSEYGMEESWTRLLVVDLKEFPESMRDAKVQAFTKSGQLILQTLGFPNDNIARCLYSYDPETKNFRVMHSWCKDYDVSLCSYVKSLVLLNAGTGVQVEDHEMMQSRNRKQRRKDKDSK